MFPLRYTEGGVLRRRGHTEAAVDLARLAGLPPAGVVCEVINDDGTMMRLPALREFADEHGLALISIEQLIELPPPHRAAGHPGRARPVIPNAYGDWRAYGYRSDIDGTEHLALVLGDLERGDGEDVLTRVHSECLTGDVFGSQRCDCGAQLEAAMAAIAERGRGVVLYLRGHEGRGIGLLSASCRPTSCRTPARTRWTPTSSSACRSTPASTRSPRSCSTTSASARSGC